MKGKILAASATTGLPILYEWLTPDLAIEAGVGVARASAGRAHKKRPTGLPIIYEWLTPDLAIEAGAGVALATAEGHIKSDVSVRRRIKGNAGVCRFLK